MVQAETFGHERVHRSVLAASEKRLLVWMAERLPRVINADHLSGLGLLAMLGAGLAYVASRWSDAWLLGVVVGLVLNWFGDSLDGTVARVRDEQRPRYGYYVDHVIDIVGTLCLLGGLALSPYMSPVVALLLLVAYLMLCAEAYLATHARGIFRMSLLGFGPTELRLLLGGGTLYLYVKPVVTILGERLLLFDVAGVVAAVAMFMALAVTVARNTLALYLAEPLPSASLRRRTVAQGPVTGRLAGAPIGGGGRLGPR